jgi:hypothetical protein
LRLLRIRKLAVLNKQKCHFFSFTKSENRRAEQVLPGRVGTSGRRGGGGEIVKKGEYCANTVHTCMQMEK